MAALNHVVQYTIHMMIPDSYGHLSRAQHPIPAAMTRSVVWLRLNTWLWSSMAATRPLLESPLLSSLAAASWRVEGVEENSRRLLLGELGDCSNRRAQNDVGRGSRAE